MVESMDRDEAVSFLYARQPDAYNERQLKKRQTLATMR